MSTDCLAIATCSLVLCFKEPGVWGKRAKDEEVVVSLEFNNRYNVRIKT